MKVSDFLSDWFGGGKEKDSDDANKQRWLDNYYEGGAPSGRNLKEDKANNSQAGSVSGNGGVVGPISAAVGDISASLGGSADGDNSFDFGDFGTGRNKTYTTVQTSGISSLQLLLIGGFAFIALKMTGGK